ncbi:MAG: hypothetical protein ABSC61_02430 [Anaerolineales bacterium]
MNHSLALLSVLMILVLACSLSDQIIHPVPAATATETVTQTGMTASTATITPTREPSPTPRPTTYAAKRFPNG